MLSRLIRRTVLRRSMAILGARLVIPLAFFALSVVVARLLGPEALGQYATIMSLHAIFSLVSSMGLENLLLREVAKAPEQAGEHLVHTLVLGLVSSSACALLLTVTGHLLGYDPEVRRRLLWLTLVFLPGFVNIVAELLFLGLNKAGHAFALASIREGTLVLLSVYFITKGAGLGGVIMALVLSRVLGAVLALLFCKTLGVPVRLRLRSAFLTRLVKLIPTFLFINLLSNILLEIDIIILSKLAPAPDVGVYMVAKKLVRSCFLLIFSVMTALTPELVRVFQQSGALFGQRFRSMWWRMLGASTVLALGVVVMAGWAVDLAYGAQYASAAGLIRILGWSLIPLSLSFLLSRFLIVANHQKKDLLALAIATSVLVATGIASVVAWGPRGMAVANVVSISLLALLHYGLAQRYLFRPPANGTADGTR